MPQRAARSWSVIGPAYPPHPKLAHMGAHGAPNRANFGFGPRSSARPADDSAMTTVDGMRALRSFTVRPSLPSELGALEHLAMNLRWSWDEQTRDLFRWVDPDGWDATLHDPVRLLGTV